jgi:hypothetical protein
LSPPEPLAPQDAPQARIAVIEEQIESLHARVESCRKAATAAQLAVAAGSATMAAWMMGLAGASELTALVFALALILGGIVWYGANQASRAAAVDAIVAAEKTRAELIQLLPLQVIDGS